MGSSNRIEKTRRVRVRNPPVRVRIPRGRTRSIRVRVRVSDMKTNYHDIASTPLGSVQFTLLSEEGISFFFYVKKTGIFCSF